MPLPLLCCLIGLVFTVIMAMVGGLLNRSINQMDKKLDANCDAVAAITADLQGYKQLVEYLRDEVKEQKTENRVLRDAHHAIDKSIAVAAAMKGAAH
ncbi:hypothetical protein KB206_10665 [Microvirga sp. STS02]|uniref:hypothetical protein n=1 Tax=Hymenobacter negativus TaxID=2795026 RepID=UPI0018DD12E1|nr:MULTISPECIES: hypothetical protein [Bacteria]MBH8569348.1 hypothetical protein [Hymenobacter negativus]MBR7209082.1 hypothetical protein [Microvirga sp. STS02]